MNYSFIFIILLVHCLSHTLAYGFEHLAACPEVSEQVKLGELHYENYEEGKIAAPKSLIYYVTHQATFKRDLKK